VVEHDMRVVASSDYVIDIGPGAGEEGGQVVASGPPVQISRTPGSQTAPYLARFLDLNHSIAV
jgi:excinuclease ABC subunit A